VRTISRNFGPIRRFRSCQGSVGAGLVAAAGGEAVDGLGGIAEDRESDSRVPFAIQPAQQRRNHLGTNAGQVLELVDDHVPNDPEPLADGSTGPRAFESRAQCSARAIETAGP
jgi:hypothetical protein